MKNLKVLPVMVRLVSALSWPTLNVARVLAPENKEKHEISRSSPNTTLPSILMGSRLVFRATV